ncbi:MAG: toll/interleukin-1 receptor domain-containing protein [Xenococcaceae cyanobacterium]
MPDQYDVFLCHNSQDKPEVIEIAQQLQKKGLRPWLDLWELTPGQSWQELLEEQIEQVKSAAVLVGSSGLGPWQEREMRAFLSEFVERNCPVIPVLLKSAPQKPNLPIFLKAMTWVDFRRSEPDPIDQLIWGITGVKPKLEQRSSTSSPQPMLFEFYDVALFIGSNRKKLVSSRAIAKIREDLAV